MTYDSSKVLTATWLIAMMVVTGCAGRPEASPLLRVQRGDAPRNAAPKSEPSATMVAADPPEASAVSQVQTADPNQLPLAPPQFEARRPTRTAATKRDRAGVSPATSSISDFGGRR